MKLKVLLLILLLLQLLHGCGDHDADRAELERIDSLASNRQPRRALELLDSMDAHDLSASNRNLHELLRIKARDKDFQQHRSNTAILRLVDYYRRHPSEGRYAEALYYAGRVHYDLGDYPSALKYYQQALDEYQRHDGKTKGASIVLYQIGHLLNRLRLYDEAASYLQEAAELLLASQDTIESIQCYELLGSIYLHEEELEQAEANIDKGLYLVDGLPNSPHTFHEKGRLLMYKGGVKIKQNDVSQAHDLLFSSRDYIDSITYPTWIGFVADIFLLENKKDSAFRYSRTLTKIVESKNRKHGYQILFTPEIISFIDTDSLPSLVMEYSNIMEDFVSENADEAAILQNSLYNYRTIEDRLTKSEKKLMIRNWICAIVVVLILLVSYLLFIGFRKSQRLSSELKSAREECLLFEQAVFSSVKPSTGDQNIAGDAEREKKQSLLRESLLALLATRPPLPEIPRSILNSPCYRSVEDETEGKSRINGNEFWKELEGVVLATSPEFRHRLNVLAGGELKAGLYHLALALRCGFTSAQCARVMHKGVSSLSYRRKCLAEVLFGPEFDRNDLNLAIRLI